MSNHAPRLSIYCLLAFVKIFISLRNAPGFELFLDEYYYIACSKRLDFGYVDNPPLSFLILWLVRTAFGDDAVALRLPAALASAASMVFVGLTVKRLGGRLLIQFLAMLMLLVSPAVLMYGGMYSMHPFEHLTWAMGGYVLVRLLNEDAPGARWWLLLGLIMGLGLQNRLTVVVFGITLTIALLLTRHRRQFLEWPIWAGGCIALLIFLPHLIWQHFHGWPTLEYLEAVRGSEPFLINAMTQMNPLLLPVWIGGLAYGWWAKLFQNYRIFPIMFLLSCLLFFMTGGKAYYLVPAHFLIAPAAAFFLGAILTQSRIFAAAVVLLICASGVLFAQHTLPLFPAEAYAPVDEVARRSYLEDKDELPFPLQLRCGWSAMADFVGSHYAGLPMEVQENCVLYTSYYGVAAALEFYRPEAGLPAVYSRGMNFYTWGPPPPRAGYVLVYSSFPENIFLGLYFHEIEYQGLFTHPYSASFLSYHQLYLCSAPRYPIEEIWQNLGRHY